MRPEKKQVGCEQVHWLWWLGGDQELLAWLGSRTGGGWVAVLHAPRCCLAVSSGPWTGIGFDRVPRLLHVVVDPGGMFRV